MKNNDLSYKEYTDIEYYAKEAKEATIPEEDNPYEYQLKENKKHMDKVALITDKGEKITYEEFHTRVEEYANALKLRGIRQGDKIALAPTNTPASIYLKRALYKIGATVCAINPIENNYNTMKDIEIVKPKMFIGVNLFSRKFSTCAKRYGVDCLFYSPFDSINVSKKEELLLNVFKLMNGNIVLNKNKKISTWLSLEDGLEYTGIEFSKDNNPYISDITFTGGSSGTHKGVMLTGKGLSAVTKGVNYVLPLKEGDVFLGNLPEFMAFGAFSMQYALNRSLSIELTSKAMPKDFANELYRTKPNGVFGGPIQWEAYILYVLSFCSSDVLNAFKKFEDLNIEEQDRFYDYVERSLLNLDSTTKKKLKLEFLKAPVSGGEQLKTRTERLLTIIFKVLGIDCGIYNGLGMTEMWAPVCVKRGIKDNEGTIGYMLPFVGAKIVNPQTLEELPKGKEGLLLVNGPGMMTGYYNNQKETDKVMIKEKTGEIWLNTGDIAVIDPKTNEKKFIDRLKRSFVCGVTNIYPQRIENKLSEIPEILESAVTKIPSDDLQFVSKYHISISQDTDISKLEKKINTLIYGTLGEPFLPHYIEFTYEQLPKSSNGKVAWNLLQKQDDEKLKKGTLEKRLVMIKK